MKLLIYIGMMLLFIGVATATLTIQEVTFDIGENLTYTYLTFDDNGLLVTPTCTWSLYDGEDELNATGTGFIDTPIDHGEYSVSLYCNDGVNATQGGYTSFSFKKNPTILGNVPWTEPTSWTFPIFYFVLTAIVILLGLSYSSSIMGIFGSIMLIFSYFLVGATAPLLFSPLIIIGVLLGFKFATI